MGLIFACECRTSLIGVTFACECPISNIIPTSVRSQYVVFDHILRTQITGTTYNDSFNTSSATDNGTGDYTIAIGNDMGSANFSISANCLNSSTQNTDCYVKAMAAGTVQTQIRTGDSGSSTDKQTFVSVHGDLA